MNLSSQLDLWFQRNETIISAENNTIQNKLNVTIGCISKPIIVHNLLISPDHIAKCILKLNFIKTDQAYDAQHFGKS